MGQGILKVQATMKNYNQGIPDTIGLKKIER